MCKLTQSPLPDKRVCCHFNVEALEGVQHLDTSMIGFMRDGLIDFGYAVELKGDVAIAEVNQFPIPSTYGKGTEDDSWGDDWDHVWEDAIEHFPNDF